MIEVKLFRKTPPVACPKCKEVGSWCPLPYEGPGRQAENISTPLSSAPIMTTRESMGPSGENVQLRYHCGKCGYEKAY